MNKKTYTKKQITEAIAYWRKVLESIDEADASKNKIIKCDFILSTEGYGTTRESDEWEIKKGSDLRSKIYDICCGFGQEGSEVTKFTKVLVDGEDVTK